MKAVSKYLPQKSLVVQTVVTRITLCTMLFLILFSSLRSELIHRSLVISIPSGLSLTVKDITPFTRGLRIPPGHWKCELKVYHYSAGVETYSYKAKISGYSISPVEVRAMLKIRSQKGLYRVHFFQCHGMSRKEALSMLAAKLQRHLDSLLH